MSVPLLRNLTMLFADKVMLKGVDREWVRALLGQQSHPSASLQNALEAPNDGTLYRQVRALYANDFRRNKGLKRCDSTVPRGSSDDLALLVQSAVEDAD